MIRRMPAVASRSVSGAVGRIPGPPATLGAVADGDPVADMRHETSRNPIVRATARSSFWRLRRVWVFATRKKP